MRDQHLIINPDRPTTRQKCLTHLAHPFVVAIFSFLGTAIVATIPILLQRSSIEALEAEIQPFRILALQKVGSMDAKAMADLLVILTNHEALLLKNQQTISNLHEELRIQTDPKKQAANLEHLSTVETILGSDSSTLLYHFVTNGEHRVFLRLKHPALKTNLEITAINPPHAQMRLAPTIPFTNLICASFDAIKEPLPMSNMIFYVSYLINPNTTNLVNLPTYKDGNFYIDGHKLNLK